MQIVADIQVLVLVAVANTAPLIAKLIFGDRFSRAIDNGTVLWDGQPLFGSSKTIRGAALSIVATTALAPLVGLGASIGLFTGISAMAGDLCSSFCKRRFGFKPSDRATGLDQIPESLLPDAGLPTDVVIERARCAGRYRDLPRRGNPAVESLVQGASARPPILGAMQAVQCYFGGAVEPDRNNGRADADRGVARHALVPPQSRSQTPRQD